jgi:hypothetical protein
MAAKSAASAVTTESELGMRPSLALAEDFFRDALQWLAATYPRHGFSSERELVGALQLRLSQIVRREGILFWRVFNDSPGMSGAQRPLSADLVIAEEATGVLLAAEFSFEPHHERHDIPAGEFPGCTWKDIEKDCMRATEFVAQGKAQVAYAILVDEGGCFKERTLSMGQTWSRWRGDRPDSGPWVLSHRVPTLGLTDALRRMG